MDDKKQIDEENKDYSHQGSNEKKDRKDKKSGKSKPGKSDNNYRSNIVESFMPNDKQVSAISLMETKVEEVTNSAIPFAVLHSAIWCDSIYTRAMSNNSDKVRSVVKKIAAQYFSQVSPTTVADIMDKVGQAITASMEIFALICYIWKVQNALQYEDEDGYNLKSVLFSTFDLHRCVSHRQFNNGAIGTNNDIKSPGDWVISNAAWKKDILSRLKKIYISDNFASLAYNVIGHFIKFDYADEELIRLWDVFPHELYIFLGSATGDHEITYADFVKLLSDREDIIDNAYNNYPFLEEVLIALGLTKPEEKFDFTRDLAQMRLKVLSDRDHALENLCYMVETQRSASTDLPDNIVYRIVSTQLPSVAMTFYEDDRESSDSLIYINRITVQIASLTNALRGAIEAAGLTWIYKNLGSNTKTSWISGSKAILPNTAAATPEEGAKAKLVSDTNWILTNIDMPNDLTYIGMNGWNNMSAYGADSNLFYGPDAYRVYPMGGNYCISAGDINSVVSDACAFTLFDTIKVPSVSQTLGDSGK